MFLFCLGLELFANDENPSDELITQGPFAMHRNPFYASVGASIMSMLGALGASNLLSEAPGPGYLAALAVGTALFGLGTHKGAVRDEAVLSKQFGSEYDNYKARTPRYLPAVWKLFT